MRYASIATLCTDPYRAGIAIGEGLRDLAPEVVLLFASCTYEPDFTEFFHGLDDALEGLRPLVVGGTGDGFLEATLASHYGVCALGIHSAGTVRWSAGLRAGAREDSRGAAREAAQAALDGRPDPPGFCFVLADGTRADGTAIALGMRDVVKGLFFGGLTGDDRKFTCSRVFHGGREHENAVVVLMGHGPLPHVLNAASGWQPCGATGVVQSADASTIRRIDDDSPRNFMAGQIGKPLGETDMGMVPLATFDEELAGHFSLRAPSSINEETGDVTIFGSIAVGARVKVCKASRADVLTAINHVVEGLMTPAIGFTPQAAILISCAGRKWLLDDDGSKEVAAFRQALGVDLHIVGFPSFGEIGPFRLEDGRSTPSCFHNVTFVACLLG